MAETISTTKFYKEMDNWNNNSYNQAKALALS